MKGQSVVLVTKRWLMFILYMLGSKHVYMAVSSFGHRFAVVLLMVQ